VNPAAHPFWLLSLGVREGQATPFAAWILWHYHYRLQARSPA
jgi:hypothetical protein